MPYVTWMCLYKPMLDSHLFFCMVCCNYLKHWHPALSHSHLNLIKEHGMSLAGSGQKTHPFQHPVSTVLRWFSLGSSQTGDGGIPVPQHSSPANGIQRYIIAEQGGSIQLSWSVASARLVLHEFVQVWGSLKILQKDNSLHNPLHQAGSQD